MKAISTVIMASLLLFGCSDGRVSAQIERNVVLPAGAVSLDRYARYYAYGRADEDMSFTTYNEDSDRLTDERADVVMGLYHLPRFQEDDQPGTYWTTPQKMPLITHDGCETVNVLARRDDPGKVWAWCNVDGSVEPLPPPGISSEADPAGR